MFVASFLPAEFRAVQAATGDIDGREVGEFHPLFRILLPDSETCWVRPDIGGQLAREDGVDRLAVAVGEAFQGQDLEAGDAHFQVGQAEELGDGVREVERRGRQRSLS